MAECSTGSSSSREKSDIWNFFEKVDLKLSHANFVQKSTLTMEERVI